MDNSITKYIDKPTSYSMTLNTGGAGVKFSDKAKRIIVKGKNDSSSFTLYSFGIFQPILKTCELEPLSYTPANYTFIPHHTAEDAEYNGHGPIMNFSVKLIVYPERVDAEMYMSAVETGGDPTVAEETRRITIYNAPANYRINRIIGQYTSALPNPIEDRDEEGFTVNLSGPVQQVILYGDGPDDNDAGTFTRGEITFAPLKIECEKLGNCIPRSQSLDSLKTSIKILAADQKLYNSYLIK